MRGADLIGLPVVGPGGEDLGRVRDVRLVQDGPLLGAFAALRVQGLVVGRTGVASRLGYDRYDAHGPWLVKRLVSALTSDNGFLPWEDVELHDDHVRATAPPQDVPSIS